MAAIPEMILNLVTAFLPPSSGEFHQLQLGDPCISYHRNFHGVCVEISDCVPAIYAHSTGIPLEYCQPIGKDRTELVVCCESAYEPFPTFRVKANDATPQKPPPPQWGRLPPPQWGPPPPQRGFLPSHQWGPPPPQNGPNPPPQWGPPPPQRRPLPPPRWGPQPSLRGPPSPPRESWGAPLPPKGPTQPLSPSIQPQIFPTKWLPPSTTSPTITPEPPLLSDEAVQDDTEDCLPKPDYAVKVKKNGRRSWNECISYAGSVFPCFYSEAKDGEYSQPLCFRDAPSAALEFPHMAMLGFPNGRKIDWRCSGSLISEDWVLTAAHCTFYKGSKVKYVRLGEIDLSKPYYSYELYKVDDIKIPDNYRGDSMYDDIALVCLDKLVTFTPMARPACIHAGRPIDDSKMTVTGWSTTYPMDNKTTTLQKVELEKFSHKECSQALPPLQSTPLGIIDKTQICAGHHTSTLDSCKGFSGGPLQIYNDDSIYCTYLIVGVTSFGRGECGTPGLPAVYTRVSAYIDWIESIVWPQLDD